MEVHFNRSKIFLLYFYDAHDVSLWKKSSADVRLTHVEQMLCRIPWFYEKRIGTVEDLEAATRGVL